VKTCASQKIVEPFSLLPSSDNRRVFRLTKLRITFYEQIERASFRTAWTPCGHSGRVYEIEPPSTPLMRFSIRRLPPGNGVRKRPLLTIKKLVFIEGMERLGRFLSALAALVLLATSPSAALRRAHRLFLGAKRPMAGEPRMTGYAHTCRSRYPPGSAQLDGRPPFASASSKTPQPTI